MKRLALIFAFALHAYGAPSLVTAKVNYNINSTASLATATYSATGGYAIIAGCVQGSTSSTMTVTDTALNTYTALTQYNRSDGFSSVQLFYAKNITGNASNATTCHYSGSPGYVAVYALQYSGLDTSAPYDTGTDKGGNASSGSTLTSASFNTANASEVTVAIANAAGTVTFTAGSGYTVEATDANYSSIEDRIWSSTQTGVTASFTQSGSASWVIGAASFKAAGAGPACSPSLSLTGAGKC